MSRRTEQGGKSYRVRRGKLVQIPERWVGQVTHPQTIQKRPSKAVHKLRKRLKYGDACVTRPGRGSKRREQQDQRAYCKQVQPGRANRPEEASYETQDQ